MITITLSTEIKEALSLFLFAFSGNKENYVPISGNVDKSE
jgi:hypothetical protein